MKKQYIVPQVEQTEWMSLTHLCNVSAGGGGYTPVAEQITE